MSTNTQRFAGVAMAIAAAVTATGYAIHAIRLSEEQFVGHLELSESALNFAVSGTIESVLVHAGEKVRRGEVVARLNPGDLPAALRSDQRALTVGKARLRAAVRSDGSRASILAARAGILHDRHTLARDRTAMGNTMLFAPSSGVITAVLGAPGSEASAAGVRLYLPLNADPRVTGVDSPLTNPQVPRARVATSRVAPVAIERVSGNPSAVVGVAEDDIRRFALDASATVSIPALQVSGVDAEVATVSAQPLGFHRGIGYQVTFALGGIPTSSVRDGMTADVTLQTGPAQA